MVGGLVVVLGVVMIVLPGPAVIVIPFGFAILATEFEWAQRILLQLRALGTRVLDRIKRRRPRSLPLT
jgi:tellurite resistance protein TerC